MRRLWGSAHTPTRPRSPWGRLLAGTALLIVLAAAPAEGKSFYLNVYDDSACLGDAVEELRIRVNVKDQGKKWFFEIRNLSTIESSITGVFFEKGLRTSKTLNRTATLDYDNRGRVRFRPTEAVLKPAANGHIDWDRTGLSLSASSIRNGVSNETPREWLRFTIDKSRNKPSLKQLIAMLQQPGYRLAVQLTGFPAGSASLVTGEVDQIRHSMDHLTASQINAELTRIARGEPTAFTDIPARPIANPTPGAAAAGLALLAASAARRTRPGNP